MNTPADNDRYPKGQRLKETVRKNKFFTGVLVALVIALPLITISEINKVEAGGSERVVFPIGTIYNSFGYWPAILFLPVCMLAFAAFIVVRFILPRRK